MNARPPFLVWYTRNCVQFLHPSSTLLASKIFINVEIWIYECRFHDCGLGGACNLCSVCAGSLLHISICTLAMEPNLFKNSCDKSVGEDRRALKPKD